MVFVYQIRNTISGKCYIGKTNEPDLRWSRHKYLVSSGSKQAIHEAMRKHGVDSFVFEVIASYPTHDEAFEAEKQLIVERKTICPQGYNMNEGGKGGTNPIPEVCAKITSALKGVKHPDERRQRESVKRSGSGNPMFGRRHKPETIEKMKAAWERRKNGSAT